jgi:hypothetical protein
MHEKCKIFGAGFTGKNILFDFGVAAVENRRGMCFNLDR